MAVTATEARARICAKPKRVLLLPPDITRMHSGSGRLTELLYHQFASEADVHVIPTLGQHVPHTPDENRTMFGSVHFAYADLGETLARYRPEMLIDGWNRTADGEEFYFIQTPSAGLWATADRLANRE